MGPEISGGPGSSGPGRTCSLPPDCPEPADGHWEGLPGTACPVAAGICGNGRGTVLGEDAQDSGAESQRLRTLSAPGGCGSGIGPGGGPAYGSPACRPDGGPACGSPACGPARGPTPAPGSTPACGPAYGSPACGPDGGPAYGSRPAPGRTPASGPAYGSPACGPDGGPAYGSRPVPGRTPACGPPCWSNCGRGCDPAGRSQDESDVLSGFGPSRWGLTA